MKKNTRLPALFMSLAQKPLRLTWSLFWSIAATVLPKGCLGNGMAKQPWQRVLLGGLLWILSPQVIAFSAINRNFDELVALADVVLIGNAVAQRSEWHDPVAQDLIYTYVTFDALEPLKGEVAQERYELRLAGGVVPPFSQTIPGSPQFTLGRRYILFIKDNQQVLFPLVGVNSGIFMVQPLSADKAVINTLEGDLVTAIEQNVVVTERVNNASNKRLAVDEGMTLVQFKEAIRQRLVNSNVKP